MRRKGDLVLLDLQLSLEVVAGALSKFTLLPADFPNWRMAEVSVCEKPCRVGIETAHLLVSYGSSIMELNLS